MTSFRYLLASTWRNLTDNGIMNVVSMGSIALALMVAGGVLLLRTNATQLMNELKSRTTVVVFLEPSVSETRREDIESKLISNPIIREVTFRSKDDAMNVMKSRLGEDLVSGLGTNPFPASFRLSLQPDRLDRVDDLTSTVSGWQGVSDVDYGEQALEHLGTVSRVVAILLGTIGLIVCVVSVFVVFNTIQLTVMSREKEIGILKLVGATRWFIGTPFLLNGAIQGITGCFLGTGFLWLLYWTVTTRLKTVEFFPLDPIFLGIWQGGLLLLLGLLLGVIGSGTAVNRSLRRL